MQLLRVLYQWTHRDDSSRFACEYDLIHKTGRSNLLLRFALQPRNNILRQWLEEEEQEEEEMNERQ